MDNAELAHKLYDRMMDAIEETIPGTPDDNAIIMNAIAFLIGRSYATIGITETALVQSMDLLRDEAVKAFQWCREGMAKETEHD